MSNLSKLPKNFKEIYIFEYIVLKKICHLKNQSYQKLNFPKIIRPILIWEYINLFEKKVYLII